MDTLTFISNMTAALAWPTAVAIVGVLYRKELRRVFASMKKLKVGPMEAEMFEMRAMEAKQLAVALAPPPRSGEAIDRQAADTAVPLDVSVPIDAPWFAPSGRRQTSAERKEEDRLLDLASYAPRLAIVEMWKLVEEAIRSLAQEHKMEGSRTFMVMVYELANRGFLRGVPEPLIRKLYDLRNDAASTTVGFSPEAALDYLVATQAVLETMRPK